ncbi:hypothetical protein [Streptomyces sp. A012304]|nr:hypothetical protein [Streptomyces sp. A012304]GKQ33562.1 hypothetical protein ALMP_01130 [Streptomyces sp. A012304]
MEAPDNGIHQAMGLVNLAPDEWFEPFREDQAPHPDRGFGFRLG